MAWKFWKRYCERVGGFSEEEWDSIFKEAVSISTEFGHSDFARRVMLGYLDELDVRSRNK